MSRLHIDSIVKSYGHTPLLSDVFLRCDMGEIVGVLGRNGCGKSTLLKIVFGVEPAANRFVRVGEKVIRGVSDTRGVMGFLPQEGFLPGGVRIKRLIRYFLPKENRRALCDHDLVGPLLERKVDHLSGGEWRLLEVLMMVHSPATFLLLDEPFTGIAPVVKEALRSILLSCKGRKGILITDHDYESVLGLADRVVLLQDGSTKPIGDPGELVGYGYLSREGYEGVFEG